MPSLPDQIQQRPGHPHGIASYCHPENKVSLGLVEGVNNKIVFCNDAPTAIATRNISS